ncbi:hypothetical protein Ancab_026398 [Ancistrocladus abbreviatus]
MKSLHKKQEEYSKPCNSDKAVRQLQQESELYINEFKANTKEDELLEVSTEIFPGFLTIGTLSIDPVIAEPPTPKFVLPSEETTEENMDDRTYDLKFISNELEKLIKAEAEKMLSKESSWRHSQPTTKTGSKGIQGEEDENTYVEVKVFPLQGYLSGSFDVAETKKDAERKTPLQELSHIIRVTDGMNLDRRQTHNIKKFKTPLCHVQKMLQQLRFSSKKFKATTEEAAVESVPAKTKFHKIGFNIKTSTAKNCWSRRTQIQQLLNKQLRHEKSTTAKDFNKFGYKIKKNPSKCNHYNGYPIPQMDCKKSFSQEAMKLGNQNHKGGMQLLKNEIKRTNLKQETTGCSSNGPSREHWIITDAECKCRLSYVQTKPSRSGWGNKLGQLQASKTE